MIKKLPITTRGIILTAFLLILAGLLNTTPVQSAYPLAPAVGTLMVIKTVTNDNNGNAVAADFTINISGNNPSPSSFPGEEAPGTTVTLDPGLYSVSEEPFVGYDASLSTDCSGTIAEGETKVCTITNNDIAPQLTLIKDPTNDNGGTTLPDDFHLTIGGAAASSGVSYPLDANTQYAINETQVSGYTFISITGDTKCPTALGETLILDEGDNITCTITNDDISPTLTIIKNVVNNGGNLNPGDFTINVSGTNVSTGSFPGAASPGTTVTLDAGSFNVSENSIFGYSPTYSADCSGTINIGETKTCSITNNNVPAIMVTPSGGLVTSENGASDYINVELTTTPSDKVTILVNTDNPDEGIPDPNPTILNFNNSNWNVPKTVKIIGVDDYVVDGDIDYHVKLDPKSSDATEYSGLSVLNINATNQDAPSIKWYKPVGDTEVYYMKNFNLTLFEVINPGNEPIHKVSISRWVPSANDWDTIAEFFDPPYRIFIDPSEFNIGFNQINAFAWGPPGGDQRYSSQPYIFLFKGYGIFLPLLAK